MPDGAAGSFEQMLVHNLKAPLTGILATLEMLGDGDMGTLSPPQREAVSIMQSQGAELLSLIEELLETWRLDAPGVPVRLQPVDLVPLLHEVETEWSSRFGGRLSVALGDAVGDAMADPAVLRRLLANLLMNALMHGGTAVSVRVVVESGDGTVTVTVADDGPGIAPSSAERIFEPFVRLEPARHRSDGMRSTGMGLAYCRAAATAMGGSISLVNDEARGASFRVVLPAPVAAPADVRPES